MNSVVIWHGYSNFVLGVLTQSLASRISSDLTLALVHHPFTDIPTPQRTPNDKMLIIGTKECNRFCRHQSRVQIIEFPGAKGSQARLVDTPRYASLTQSTQHPGL